VRLWTREEDEVKGEKEPWRPHLAGAIAVGKPPPSGHLLAGDEASGTPQLRALVGGCRTRVVAVAPLVSGPPSGAATPLAKGVHRRARHPPSLVEP
jgi:hypothetical protein